MKDEGGSVEVMIILLGVLVMTDGGDSEECGQSLADISCLECRGNTVDQQSHTECH